MNNHNNIQSQFWDGMAGTVANVKLTSIAIQEMNNFFDFICLQKKMKILEIGCGTGRWTLPLLRMGHQVTGTDVSAQCLKELNVLAQKEKLSNQLFLKKTNFQEPFFKEQFDLVICGCVIHHFDPNYKEIIMQNMTKALKKGGRIALFEPNAYYPPYFPWYLFLELSRKQKGVLQAGLKNIEIKKHTIIPLRLEKFLKSVDKINQTLERIPMINNLSAYLD